MGMGLWGTGLGPRGTGGGALGGGLGGPVAGEDIKRAASRLSLHPRGEISIAARPLTYLI